MSRRDAWARLTPYEVGIPGRDYAEKAFAAIREEAEVRGSDASDPGAFFQLGEVGRVIREIQGDERGREAIEQFGAFLYHAYHFHQAGEPLYLLGTATARRLVEEGPPSAPWTGTLPAEAGYLQLPRHLFWSRSTGEEGPAEPLDGLFWARAAGGSLTLMVALGLRGDRPGISVVELPPLPLADAAEWVRGGTRPEGADFATELPGGDLDDLYSIVTLGEVLTLAARTFALMDREPYAIGPDEQSPKVNGGAAAAEVILPSLLPFRRIGESEPDTGPEPSPRPDA